MSTGEGSGAGTEFATMRGRDYPSIRQFTVFLENRVGQLMDVVRRFEGSNVRIVALTISDSTECALVRFLLSDPEQGREILERAGLAIVESDLIGVELPDSPATDAANLHGVAGRRSEHHANLSTVVSSDGPAGRGADGRQYRNCRRDAALQGFPRHQRRRAQGTVRQMTNDEIRMRSDSEI